MKISYYQPGFGIVAAKPQVTGLGRNHDSLAFAAGRTGSKAPRSFTGLLLGGILGTLGLVSALPAKAQDLQLWTAQYMGQATLLNQAFKSGDSKPAPVPPLSRVPSRVDFVAGDPSRPVSFNYLTDGASPVSFMYNFKPGLHRAELNRETGETSLRHIGWVVTDYPLTKVEALPDGDFRMLLCKGGKAGKSYVPVARISGKTRDVSGWDGGTLYVAGSQFPADMSAPMVGALAALSGSLPGVADQLAVVQKDANSWDAHSVPEVCTN